MMDGLLKVSRCLDTPDEWEMLREGDVLYFYIIV